MRGATTQRKAIKAAIMEFQSTRPMRGATSTNDYLRGTLRYFNPRAPRGARPYPRGSSYQRETISIHAPREGRDRKHRINTGIRIISIHAPREGRDGLAVMVVLLLMVISIHAPREGRDGDLCIYCVLYHEISIHAPREGRDRLFRQPPAAHWISIHAPREGRDLFRK